MSVLCVCVPLPRLAPWQRCIEPSPILAPKPQPLPSPQGQLAFEAGGIKVDGNFRTSVPGVYAVGDVAAFPLLIDGGKTSRQEHVTFARRSAEHAVASLIDQATPAFDYLPFFYSR